jgi:uncharacterized integral membrane protein
VVAALILVPLAVLIIAFAVVNRQVVTVALDPFSADRPAAVLTLPLFALVIAVRILGIMIGGVAAWLRRTKWRRIARRLEREVAELHGKLESLKGAGESARLPAPVVPPERVQLRPPVQ